MEEMPNSDIVYVRSADLLHDAQQIIESAREMWHTMP
jgi:hypothetical protein